MISCRHGGKWQSKLNPPPGWRMCFILLPQSSWLWSWELWFVIRVTFNPHLSPSDMCIASAISLLMILICGMATYGAYKVNLVCPEFIFLKNCPVVMKTDSTCLFQLRAAWIIPFFCYQIFDFALNTLVAVSIVVYPNTIQDYLQQLVGNGRFCDCRVLQ